ncbi:ROK family protein [Kitasatospora sp. NPDC057015]|uniref:ROK family protein n=1 Tax=Kitasatospora sp. NPDC057015 TaxID=3346001 RepID=UPI00364302C9
MRATAAGDGPAGPPRGGAAGPTVAGLDIGGTKISAGLVGADGWLGRVVTVPTPAAQGPAAVIEAAAAAVRALDGRPVAVGVGSAGVIDPAGGYVLSATDALPGWAGTDLRGALRGLLGVPVAVDNDVHAHALGESWTGAAAGRRSVLLVAVGTGVGGSLVLDGRIHHGAHAAAGHVGHVPSAAAAGLDCTCGGTGHLEVVASGPALLAEYLRRGGVPGTRRLDEVATAAEAGDEPARAVLAAGATALGRAVGGLANVLDPDVVLIGGGVSRCGESWWGPLRAAVEAELLPPLRGLAVRPGALGQSAAVVGAARLGWAVAA